MLVDPHLSQPQAGLQHAVLQPLQEVTRPKRRFKPTLIQRSVTRFGEIPPLWQIFKNIWQYIQYI